MTTLVSALYTEGPTDEKFLPIIIQRTIQQILIKRGRMTVDILEPILLRRLVDHKSYGTQAERILRAARLAAGYHTLIIHADADHASSQKALTERIQPGLELVQQSQDRVCGQVLPLIPIRMTEAWMLADPATLQDVIGTNVLPQTLGLPERAEQVQSIPNPKQTLNQAIQNALAHQSRRRRRLQPGALYEPLARQLSLERLNQVPAYQQFVGEMTNTLIALHLAN